MRVNVRREVGTFAGPQCTFLSLALDAPRHSVVYAFDLSKFLVCFLSQQDCVHLQSAFLPADQEKH